MIGVPWQASSVMLVVDKSRRNSKVAIFQVLEETKGDSLSSLTYDLVGWTLCSACSCGKGGKGLGRDWGYSRSWIHIHEELILLILRI